MPSRSAPRPSSSGSAQRHVSSGRALDRFPLAARRPGPAIGGVVRRRCRPGRGRPGRAGRPGRLRAHGAAATECSRQRLSAGLLSGSRSTSTSPSPNTLVVELRVEARPSPPGELLSASLQPPTLSLNEHAQPAREPGAARPRTSSPDPRPTAAARQALSSPGTSSTRVT